MDFKIYNPSGDQKIKILYKNEIESDICNIIFFYKIPVVLEKETLGIGEFILRLIQKGSKKENFCDANKISIFLEENAIFLEMSRKNEFINISMCFLKDKFYKAMEIFFSMMNSPKFDEKEIEKVKLEMKNDLLQEDEDIHIIANKDFLKNLYGEQNSKSFNILGTEDSLNKIDFNIIQNFHKKYFINDKYFTKNPLTISIIGNLDNIDEKLNIIYKKFTENLENIDYDDKNDNLFNINNFVIEKETKFTQGFIQMGFITYDIFDENYKKIKFLNNYVGSGMSSLLFDKIREDLGLCYEIHSFYSNYKEKNYWAISLGLDKKNIDFATEEIKKVIKNFCKKGIDKRTFDILKERAFVYEIFKKEQKQNRCFSLGFNEILNLDNDWYNDFLNDISLSEINRNIPEIFDQKFLVLKFK